MWLAGDLGGTKTLLGLFREGEDRPVPVASHEFGTLDWPDLPTMVSQFIADANTPPGDVRAACIGVAGPIQNQAAVLTNVPWRVNAAETRARTGLRHLVLLNDVEILAHGLAVLRPEELAVLQDGTAAPDGNGALITVGTGLGSCILQRRPSGGFAPLPSEGGHADFAARTDREIELLRYLRERHGRVDVERVVSGPGLANVAEFTHGGTCPHMPADAAPADVPRLVSTNALAGKCPRCAEAFTLFMAALGSAAGNFAIQTVARGGVYIGGGISPKILPGFKTGPFLEAFRSKPPMDGVLGAMPIWIILEQRAGLIGAAVAASQLG